MKGYLKAMHLVLSQPAQPTPPQQESAFEGMMGLVLLNRELAKGSGANPLIAKNAEVLKRESIASINQTLAILDGAKPFEPLYPTQGVGEAASDPWGEQPASKPVLPARDTIEMAGAIPAVDWVTPASIVLDPRPLPPIKINGGTLALGLEDSIPLFYLIFLCLPPCIRSGFGICSHPSCPE